MKGRAGGVERDHVPIDRQIEHIAAQLATELDMSHESVEPLVSATFKTLGEHARIKTYVPILARRHVKAQLLRQRRSTERLMRRPPGVVA